MEEKTFKSEIFGLNKKEVEEYVNEMKYNYEEKIRKLTEANDELYKKNLELIAREEGVKEKTALVSNALIKAETQAKEIIQDAVEKGKQERAQIDNEIEIQKEKLIDIKRKILELKETVRNSLGNFSDELQTIVDNTDE